MLIFFVLQDYEKSSIATFNVWTAAVFFHHFSILCFTIGEWRKLETRQGISLENYAINLLFLFIYFIIVIVIVIIIIVI